MDSNLYQVIVKFISEQYLENIYDPLPYELKSMFEDKVIPPEVYGRILESIGLQRDIVSKLNLNEKIRFLEALSDFQRYKGSIRFFKRIASAFDRFNLYELYIDQVDDGRWLFKPIPVIEQIPSLVSDISYPEVYQEIPSLLISLDRLVTLKTESDAIFPIKSNIVLLEYDFSSKASIKKYVAI
jgi:hypothetical protein